MKLRTFYALLFLVFNSLFLAWYFFWFLLYEEVVVSETNKLIAGAEFVFVLVLAGLGIERLINLRERW